MSNKVLKWVAGIVATVMAGLILWAVTTMAAASTSTRAEVGELRSDVRLVQKDVSYLKENLAEGVDAKLQLRDQAIAEVRRRVEKLEER